MTKTESLLADFKKALERFDEILQEPKSEIVRDSAIKRFELVFDLAWKSVKNYLEGYCNIVCHSPRECFKEAFVQKLIEYDKFWFEVISLRNATVHAYNEKLANKVYQELPRALRYFQKLFCAIKKMSV